MATRWLSAEAVGVSHALDHFVGVMPNDAVLTANLLARPSSYRYTVLLAMLGSVTGAAAVLELLRSYELPDRITRSSIYARAVDMCAKRGLRAVFVSPFINISGPMLMAAACCKELDKRKVLTVYAVGRGLKLSATVVFVFRGAQILKAIRGR